jgi:hypothetical protein
MNKPSTIVYEEFKQELANLINKSGLPAFIIEPVLRDYLIEIKSLAQRQYQADKAEYEKSLAKQIKE